MQTSDSEAADELEIDVTRQEVILIPPGLEDDEMEERKIKRMQESPIGGDMSPLSRCRLCPVRFEENPQEDDLQPLVTSDLLLRKNK